MTATMEHRQTSGARSGFRPGGGVHIYQLRGRSLRFVLLDHLMSVGHATVADMVILLAERGYDLGGRASKVISDALRWEVRRNRVTRVARGVYRYRSAPATTARRVRLFARQCNRWIAATLQGRQPPPTPPDTRAFDGVGWARASDPPWPYLGWLWVS